MADLSKADKIAAGYKKLKEFQQKSRKPEPKQKKIEENVENVPPNDSNSTPSQENFTTNGSNIFTTSPENFFDETFSTNQGTSEPTTNLQESTTNFMNFDKIVFETNSNDVQIPSITSYFSNNHGQFANNFDQFIQPQDVNLTRTDKNRQPIDNNFQLINTNFQHINTNFQQVDSNFQPIDTNFQTTDANLQSTNTNLQSANANCQSLDTNFQSVDENLKLGDANAKLIDINISSIDSILQTNELPLTFSDEPSTAEPTFDITPQVQNKTTVPAEIPIELSSAENIRQLSTEIHKYIESTDSTCFLESTQNALEKRNQELANIVENQRVEISQLSLNRQEYLDRIQGLETQLHAMQSEMTVKVQQEIRPLQEQLEYYAKTTGILVGERSELTAALEKSQAIIKEKIGENEEIQCKLRASRHRVSDLERELSNVKAELDARIQTQTIENVDMLKQDLIQSKSRIEELTEDIGELTQKLNSQSQENMSLKQELAEKTNKLSLMELKLHQICNNETSQLELQVDTLNKEKLAMELKINHLAEELKSVSLEKEKTNEQYQQYVTQLNEQIKTFSQQNENLQKENEKLRKREQELVTHMGTLEKDIQTLHKQKLPPQKDTSKDLSEIQMRIASLDQLILEKNKENGKLLEEKKDLLTELELRNQHISQLEERMNDLENDKPNAARLIAAMESDKAAAAQAIKQNKKLTEQVMELQDKFVEITQKELMLTEKLESEQHLGQEILKKLKASENEVEILKQQLNEKDVRIVELERNYIKTDATDNSSFTPAITESLPRLPVNDNSSNVIQQHKEEIPLPVVTKTENSALNMTADQPACEKCKLIDDHYEKVKAMEQLEQRFKRIMDDVARLTEEKLELEHLVLQLQSETETIGEYVALYQFQRGILKQRSQEKDEELRLLNRDREHMKEKLTELNNLVQQFVTEKISSSMLIEECQKFHTEADQNDSPESIKRADKIRELISEINSSNLIEPKESVAHVCSYCSGQLITV